MKRRTEEVLARLLFLFAMVAVMVAVVTVGCEESSTEVHVTVPDTIFVVGPPDTMHLHVHGDTVWLPCPPGRFWNGKCHQGDDDDDT